MKYTRVEHAGKVGYTDGNRKLIIPTKEALRERLIKLMEDCEGNPHHKEAELFWKDRCKDTGSSDDMTRAWGIEVFERLFEIWQELTGEKKGETSESMEDIYGG